MKKIPFDKIFSKSYVQLSGIFVVFNQTDLLIEAIYLHLQVIIVVVDLALGVNEFIFVLT